MKNKLTALLLLLIVITSCRHQVSKKTIYLLTDKVNGIQQGNAVVYKGLQVGKIANISIHKENILLQMEVNLDLQVSKNSYFVLNKEGKHQAEVFELGTPILNSGDTLVAISSSNIFPQGFAEDTKNIILKVEDVLVDVNRIVEKLENQ